MSCDVEKETTFFSLCIFHNAMTVLEFPNKTNTKE